MSVTIFTKPGCPYCAAAKEDLEGRGIAYEEVDVYTVPGALERLNELTFGELVVPVVVEEDGRVSVAAGGG